MLAALGLDEREIVVYEYLAGEPSATVQEISGATGLPHAGARAALHRLIGRGFAHRAADDPDKFAAAPPRAISAVVDRRMDDLRQAQEALDLLTTRYSTMHLATVGAGYFEVIRGVDALRERALAMVTSARFEALNMSKAPVVAVQATEGLEPVPTVRGRVVFDREVITDARNLEAIRNRHGTHYEVRVHTMVPVKMLAVDRAMALVPLVQEDIVPMGLLVTRGPLLDSFLALFDYVWATATGLHVGDDKDADGAAPVALSQPDRQLLSLLLAGLTDQAIAAHFNISVRTVERKVRALLDTAHVRTRMQLAWEAARQGWL